MKKVLNWLSILFFVSFAFGSTKTVQKIPVTESRQFSSVRYDFELAGGKGFVIVPNKSNQEKPSPWLWYAPTFINRFPKPYHGWMFKQLLDRGFYVCGIDVGESHGSPGGVEIYNAFHEHVVNEYHLDKMACLMPQSRGGLMLYNWAAKYPGCVKCVAGIYPVGDIESYPGIEKACKAYRMSAAELLIHLCEYNPIDQLHTLANEGVPILHIHGDQDNVVPLETNSKRLINRYKILGGQGDLIIVPGKGHCVDPALFENQEMVDFIVKHGL